MLKNGRNKRFTYSMGILIIVEEFKMGDIARCNRTSR